MFDDSMIREALDRLPKGEFDCNQLIRKMIQGQPEKYVAALKQFGGRSASPRACAFAPEAFKEAITAAGSMAGLLNRKISKRIADWNFLKTRWVNDKNLWGEAGYSQAWMK